MNSSLRRSARAFSLVELLAVIAVIGILVAILIPVVGLVREKARGSLCASHLRQISLAVLTYANEHRGLLPSGRHATTRAYTGLYRRVEDPSHLPNGVIMDDHSQMLSSHIARFVDTGRSASLWRCPSNTALWNAMSDDSRSTYLLNNQSDTVPAFFFGSTVAGNDPAPKNIRRTFSAGPAGNRNFANAPGGGPAVSYGPDWALVRDAPKIWMITDMDSGNYGGSEGVPAIGAVNAVPRPHRDGRNYAFFDGHVEWRAFNNAPANP